MSLGYFARELYDNEYFKEIKDADAKIYKYIISDLKPENNSCKSVNANDQIKLQTNLDSLLKNLNQPFSKSIKNRTLDAKNEETDKLVKKYNKEYNNILCNEYNNKEIILNSKYNRLTNNNHELSINRLDKDIVLLNLNELQKLKDIDLRPKLTQLEAKDNFGKL